MGDKLGLAVDIDGVVIDNYGWIVKTGEEYFGRRKLRDSYSMVGMFGVSKAEEIEFWKYATPLLYEHEEPVKYSVETLEELSEYFDIHMVTNRNIAGREEFTRARTLLTLDKLKVPYSSFNMVTGCKSDTCKKLDCVAIIEDSTNNCVDTYKNGIYTLCMKYPHNENVIMHEGDLLRRIDGWKHGKLLLMNKFVEDII